MLPSRPFFAQKAFSSVDSLKQGIDDPTTINQSQFPAQRQEFEASSSTIRNEKPQKFDIESTPSQPRRSSNLEIVITTASIIRNYAYDCRDIKNKDPIRNNQITPSGNSEKSHIFLTLFIQYLIATGMVLPSIFVESYREAQSLALRLVICALWITLIILAIVKKSLCSKRPITILVFLLFSCSYGFLISCFVNQVTPQVILVETGIMSFLMFLFYLFHSFFSVGIKFGIISFILIAVINFICVINQETIVITETAVFLFFYGITFLCTCLIVDEVTKKYSSSSKFLDFFLSPVQIYSTIIETVKIPDCCVCN